MQELLRDGPSGVRLRLRGPSPIMIGVTGHRDLRADDVPQLERLVDRFFADVASRFPDSDFIVLSGLAEGADRLVATRAVAAEIPVVALLPMPLADYEKDFETQASLASFRNALALCSRKLELPWLASEETRAGDDAVARRAQYELLANELVANSALLLALWNGLESGLSGGTDSVVATARRGHSGSALSAFDVQPTFVYHIVTPRASNANTLGEPFSHSSLENAERDACLRTLLQQNTWNRDASALWHEGRKEAKHDTDRDVVERTFAIADTLAISEQVVEQRAFLSVYLLGAFAALVFGTYSTMFSDADWLLAIDIAITAVAAIAYAIAMSRNAPDRFQDYRALAEGLRVQAAWADAGLDTDVADFYTHRHRGQIEWTDGPASEEPGGKLDWIRRTVRVARQLHDFGRGEAHDTRDARERIRAVNEAWIAPQAAYFLRASTRKARMAGRCRLGWRSCAVAALGCTIFLFILVTVPAFRTFGDATAKGPLLFAIGMFSICSALVQSYSDKRALGELHKRYAVMHRTFDAATRIVNDLVEGAFDDWHAKQVVFELGKEALAENAEWMIAMRDRPIESVLSG